MKKESESWEENSRQEMTDILGNPQEKWGEWGSVVEDKIREIGRGQIFYVANSFGYYKLCKVLYNK